MSIDQGDRVLVDLCLTLVLFTTLPHSECEVTVLSTVSHTATSPDLRNALRGVSAATNDIPQEEPEEVAVFEQDLISARNHWDDLADCESGNWLNGGTSFETGSARWDWAKPGTEVPPWGTTIHHGGLQFHPTTWDWVAPMVGLGHIGFAYDATREEQIIVAEKVQELQGWGAWPVCSRKVGLR